MKALIDDEKLARSALRRLDRFGEIVKRVNLKRFHGVCVKGNQKNSHRHARGADLFDDLEARIAGHLDIQEHKIAVLGVSQSEWS